MFKYKSEAELDAMTPEQRDIYAQQKREFEATQTKAAIEEAMNAFKESQKTELEANKTALDAANKKVEDLETALKAQGEKLVELGRTTEARKKRTLEEVFKEQFDEKAEITNEGKDIQDYRLKDQIVIDTKAIVSTDVMAVDTVSAENFPENGTTGIVGATLRTIYSKVIGFFGPRIPSSKVMDYVDVQPLTDANLIVINEAWTGTAELTPECELKPIVKMTFTPQEKSADPVAAMWFTTTKLRRFYQVLVNRMEQKFAELVNKEIPEAVLAEIRANATAFTPDAALAINDNPNNYDALGAVIATLENLDYVPNVIMMNPIAWRNMKQEKNADGVYTLSNGQSIQLVANGLDWGGNVIAYVKDPKLGVDEFIIGDLMATVKVGVDSQLMYMETDGRVDAQATTSVTGLARNIRTHVLEKFIAAIIPDGSKAGLVRDTFSNVKTLITAEPTT